MYTKEQLIEMSGQQRGSSGPKVPPYPFVRLNGNEGVFESTEKVGDEYKKTPIGSELTGVILRVRRKLSDFNSGKSTTEHSGFNAVVPLFEERRKIDEGPAKELRERHPELSTEQIVYFMWNGEIVRLIVKGASLGSANKPKDSIPFYDYLSSFKGDDHSWMYETKITPKAEVNTKLRKKYFAMSFEKGAALNEENLQAVGERMKELHDIFGGYDATEKMIPNEIAKKKAEKEDSFDLHKHTDGVNQETKDEVPVVNLDDDGEIKAEDLPF